MTKDKYLLMILECEKIRNDPKYIKATEIQSELSLKCREAQKTRYEIEDKIYKLFHLVAT